MANEQPSLTTKNAESGTSSDCANLHSESLVKISYSHAEASNKAPSNADPNQTGASKEPFPEIEEAQTDMGSQRTLMCKELLEAATIGDKNTLTQLLGLGEVKSPDSAHVTIEAPNNAPNQTKNLQSATGIGNTVLHILACNGHSELAQEIYMKDRSLLEVCNNTGETALHYAARYGHSGVISQLVDKAHELEHDLKDTLRKKNRHGETALHKAAWYGHVAVVRALITEDPELAGEVNKNDESPLFLATDQERVHVVRLMVEHLCKREITFTYYSGPKRTTALHAAVLRSKEEDPPAGFIKYIPTLLLPDFMVPSGLIRRPQIDIGLDMCKELLKLESAELAKRTDIFGSTPLHYAASSGAVKVARMLLSHDASLAYCDDSLGLFPVHVAAYIGHPATVVTLLENNFDSWGLLDHRGRNFLHFGAESDTNSSIKLIIEKAYKSDTWPKLREVLSKASCAIDDNEQNTPLDLAVRGSHRRTVDFLLYNKYKINFAETSLSNLAVSFDHSNALVSKSTTDESYEKMYQHYKNQDLVAKTARSPIRRLCNYIDTQKHPESFDTLASRVQSMALGSVLIATVTFAAVLAPPGGYNSSGTAVLKGKYLFRAFILANASAFTLSFLCTFWLVYLGATQSGSSIKKKLKIAQYFFVMATICMVLAFELGVHLVGALIDPFSAEVGLFIIVVALVALGPFHLNQRFMFSWLIWCFFAVYPLVLIFSVAFPYKKKY